MRAVDSPLCTFFFRFDRAEMGAASSNYKPPPHKEERTFYAERETPVTVRTLSLFLYDAQALSSATSSLLLSSTTSPILLTPLHPLQHAKPPSTLTSKNESSANSLSFVPMKLQYEKRSTEHWNGRMQRRRRRCRADTTVDRCRRTWRP